MPSLPTVADTLTNVARSFLTLGALLFLAYLATVFIAVVATWFPSLLMSKRSASPSTGITSPRTSAEDVIGDTTPPPVPSTGNLIGSQATEKTT